MTCDVSFPQSKSTGSWDELCLTGYTESVLTFVALAEKSLQNKNMKWLS